MNDNLDSLLLLFRTEGRPLTAAFIAKKTNTYVATVKRRVEKLQEMGHKFSVSKKREGKAGFPSTAWRLVDE